MISKDSFWEELPKTKYWKKVIAIIGGIIFIVVASFGIASAKYGYKNVSYFISHGHTLSAQEKKQAQPITDDLSSKIEGNTVDSNNSGFNFSPSYSSTGSNNDFISDSSFWGNSNTSSTSSTTSPSSGKNSNSGFTTPPEYEKAGAIAICNDYTYSHEQHNSSTCSTHKGVMYWLDGSDTPAQKKKVCVQNTSMEQLLTQQYQNQVNNIKQQKEQAIGQARADMANRGIDSSSGSYLSAIQSIEDNYNSQLSNLKIEYDQQINAVEPICHYE